MDQQNPFFDLRYTLNTLCNGKWIILATTAIAMTVAVISNYFQTLQYQSWAQVQIDAPPFMPSPGQDAMAQSSYYLSMDRYFKTEKEKMTSPRMYLRFAERLRQGDARSLARSADSISTELGKGIKVEPVADTNLVTVYLTLDNPRKAADWVNLYVDLFVEENARQQEENVKQSREILRKQLDEIKSLISSQQGQVSGYVARSTCRPATGMLRLWTASSCSATSRITMRPSASAWTPRRSWRSSGHSRLPTRIWPGCPSYVVAPGLRSQYDRYLEGKAALEKMARDGKGDLHPQVVAKKTEVENLQEQLRTEVQKIAESLNVDLSLARNAGSRLVEGIQRQARGAARHQPPGPGDGAPGQDEGRLDELLDAGGG